MILWFKIIQYKEWLKKKSTLQEEAVRVVDVDLQENIVCVQCETKSWYWPFLILTKVKWHNDLRFLIDRLISRLSHPSSCFLSLLLVAAVVWKVKQTCWASRRREVGHSSSRCMCTYNALSCVYTVYTYICSAFSRKDTDGDTLVKSELMRNEHRHDDKQGHPP